MESTIDFTAYAAAAASGLQNVCAPLHENNKDTASPTANSTQPAIVML
jgi:hypothetical protein